MFVSDDGLIGVVGAMIVLIMMQESARNNPRRRKVEGSIHQYNISPSQTMWSTRFYAPKLRRLVLVIALVITVDSRALNTHQKQTVSWGSPGRKLRLFVSRKAQDKRRLSLLWIRLGGGSPV